MSIKISENVPLKITVLGSGNSTGVPAIGNFWGACDPHEPRNQRTRSSLAVQSATTTLIIDTGADFRAQMNREDIQTLDAVFYTHAHGDHVHGIDDLRVLSHKNNRELVPVYGLAETLDELAMKFEYLFKGGNHKLYPVVVEPHPLIAQDFSVGDIGITSFTQDHGTCASMGYRFGNFAYSVDLFTLDEAALEALKGVDTWVVDCAAYHNPDNPVHAHLDHIYELNKIIGARQVYLTSLSLAMDYQTLCAELPQGYAPAYDGMVLNF